MSTLLYWNPVTKLSDLHILDGLVMYCNKSNECESPSMAPWAQAISQIQGALYRELSWDSSKETL